MPRHPTEIFRQNWTEEPLLRKTGLEQRKRRTGTEAAVKKINASI